MKKHFLQLLALLCCLTMLFGCQTATSGDATTSVDGAVTTLPQQNGSFSPVFNETLSFKNPTTSKKTSKLFYNNASFKDGPLAGDPFLFYH